MFIFSFILAAQMEKIIRDQRIDEMIRLTCTVYKKCCCKYEWFM